MFENTKIELLNERVKRLEEQLQAARRDASEFATDAELEAQENDRLKEQLEAKERVLAICVDAEKITGLLEQLEAAQAAYESERKTAMYLDGILAKHHETTGWNCPVCYPATSPNGEQTRDQLLERLALTVKEAIDGGSFDGTLFESQVSGTLWLLYGEQSPAMRQESA